MSLGELASEFYSEWNERVPSIAAMGRLPVESLGLAAAESLVASFLAATGRIASDLYGSSNWVPRERALSRLLIGVGDELDESALALEVHGARLVAARVGSATEYERLRRRLDAEPGLVTVLEGDYVFALVRTPARRLSDQDQLGAARRYCTFARRLLPDLRCAISATLTDRASVSKARHDLYDGLGLGLEGGAEPMLVEDVWAPIAIARLSRQICDLLPHGTPLGSLAAANDSLGETVASTVATWLEADRDTTLAAKRLGIHVNTVRYRVNRYCELTGLDLSDFQQRAVVQLWTLAGAAVAGRAVTAVR